MILFISDLWPPFPGGAERLAFNLARDLMRRGEEVTVLTGYAHAQQFDGPPVTIRDRIGVFDTREQGAQVITEHIAAVQPDVIISHHLYASQFTEEILASGAPFVHIVLNGQRIPEASLGVFISNWVRKFGETERTDLTIIPPAFEDCVADSHGDRVGFIKPIPHKGIDTLYAVAEQVPNRQFLVLRGEWQNLEVIRTDLPNVSFMEPVDDIRDFYREVNAVLMPSKSEDAGTVAQECALNRIPCISSNVNGLAQTNQGGVLLRADDIRGFVRSVRKLSHPGWYRSIVERQALATKRRNQDAGLDEFAARVAALRS